VTARFVALLLAIAGPALAYPLPPAASRPLPPAARRLSLAVDTPPARKPRVAPPQVAFQVGLMPLGSAGMSEWKLAHPFWDGRGVLIAVLDGGVDPGVLGLLSTSTGEPKILEVRDFSGENDIPLAQVSPDGEGCVTPAATRVCGVGAIAASADSGTSAWGGLMRELPLGNPPFADLNFNGTNGDAFGIVVIRRGGQWVAYVDTNGDGSLADEQPLSDYALRRETFAFGLPGSAHRQGLVTAVVNLADDGGRPHLAIVLGGDHATHVAGIAAGHMIYGVSGFDGVAPGAQLLSLKISNNVRGGVSTTGSMLRAMRFAFDYARERRLPLVLNMSFGVGNADEGRAAMDSIIDDFQIAHPDVFFAIAAGNDGPGTSTTGEPGSAELAVAVGAAYPASFAQFQFGTATDVLGWWSSRGGELAKPDIVAPGVAYSTVPAWDQGGEVKGGTSMAAPYVSGLAAVLLSAMAQEQRPVTMAALAQALRAGARPFAGESYIDQGAGLAQVDGAYQYLRGSHEAPRYRVEALPGTPPGPGIAPAAATGSARGVAQRPDVSRALRLPLTPGAYRREDVAGAADTVQRFRVSLVPDSGIARRARAYRLVSDAPWLRTAAQVTIDSATGSAVIETRYDRTALSRPGRYAGAVRAFPVADSGATSAFVLVNTVVVSDTIAVARGARLAPGTAGRYYVTVPAQAGGLSVVLTSADSAVPGSVNLFEPTGRPARGERSDDVGGESGRIGTVRVSAEDLVPGVYEVVVQAMPGRALVYDLRARVSPIRVTGIDTAGAEPVVRTEITADTTVSATVDLVGAARSFSPVIENSGPWRLEVPVPSWAKKIVVELEVAPEVWDQVTDFSIAVYDSAGAQLGVGAMNYPYHRVSADLPADRPAGYRAVVELAPGFARPVPPARTEGRLRVRLEGDARRLAAVPALRRGAGRVRVKAFTPLAAPASWQPLLRFRAGAGELDQTATTQLFTLPPRP
jgi:subtilisin family serine protease